MLLILNTNKYNVNLSQTLCTTITMCLQCLHWFTLYSLRDNNVCMDVPTYIYAMTIRLVAMCENLLHRVIMI